MLKISEEKGLLEQAIGLSKERKQKKGKQAKKQFLVVSLKLQKNWESIFLKCNNGRTWNNIKILIE